MTEGSDRNPLAAQRLQTLTELEAAGVDPYPVGFHREDLAAELHEEFEQLKPGTETGRQATVAGRLMNIRSFGKLQFGVLRDSSGEIQLFLDRAVLDGPARELLQHLDHGDWIGATGELMTTRKGELSVRAHSLSLLAKAVRPLPEKWHGLQDKEHRLRRRYLDLIANESSRKTAIDRSTIVASLRETFQRRGFVEVETPALQLEAGGALARPFVTHHKALGIDMYLRIAIELHLKRLIVGGLERVFEIGRIFRNEGVDSTHSPEFTMLEAYQAFADYEDIMVLVAEAVREAASALGRPKFSFQGNDVDLTGDWRRLDIVDSVADATGGDIGPETPIEDLRSLARDSGLEPEDGWGAGKLIDELFEKLVQPRLLEPTFVVDHPVEISPLARLHRSKPGRVERFELFICGLEIANAFTELNDPRDQRRRFEAQAAERAAGDEEAHIVDEDFLRALEYGMPPTGGVGIGVDRLVMLLTDQPSIREVVLFPHMRPE